MIDIEDNNSSLKIVFSKNITKTIDKLLKSENKSRGQLCIVLCDDSDLLAINKKHLDHDYFTDIITFNYNDKNVVSGDLFISVERVQENAKKYGYSFENELIRVVFHGLLHLCGYNDKTNLEKVVMRFKENCYLNKFVSRETLVSVK